MTDVEKIAWMREHLAYEARMLEFTSDRLRRLPTGLEWNAFYVSFIVHARNIHDFLTNDSGGWRQRPIAKEFVQFHLGTTIDGFKELHEQVLHLGRNRPFDPALKFDRAKALILATQLKDGFEEFIREFDAAFPSTWDPELSNPYKRAGDPSALIDRTEPAETSVATTSMHKSTYPRDDFKK